MSQVIGLKFRPHGQVYFFLSGDNEIAKGDRVIVETDQGQGCGEVVLLEHETSESLMGAAKSANDFWSDAPGTPQDVDENDADGGDDKGEETQVVADAEPPEDAESDAVAPEDVAPEDVAPEDAAPEEVAPEDATPDEQPETADVSDAQNAAEQQTGYGEKTVDSSAQADKAPESTDQSDEDDEGHGGSNGATGDDLKTILRVAGPDDSEKIKENEVLASEAFQFCRDRVRERKLDMKLVDVEVFFDRSKIIFYFTAPTRIDFRELVKDLVKNYRTRIELRQIGVRHETQMIGAVGNCGMVCCCRRFLRQFDPVTIKMAKEQNLFLNPAKISGICGRLLCCLGYEQSNYEQFHRGCPKNGKKFYTTIGPVKVLRANLFRNTISLLVDGHEEREISVDEWPTLEPKRPDQIPPEELKALQEQEQERRMQGRGRRSGPPRGRGDRSRKDGNGDDNDQDRKGDRRESRGRKERGGDRKPQGRRDKEAPRSRSRDEQAAVDAPPVADLPQAKVADERPAPEKAPSSTPASPAEDDGAIFLSKPAYEKKDDPDAKSADPSKERHDSGRDSRDEKDGEGKRKGRSSRRRRGGKGRKPKSEDAQRPKSDDTQRSQSGDGQQPRDEAGKGQGGKKESGKQDRKTNSGDKPKPKRRRRRRPRGRGGKGKPQGESE